MTNDNTYSVTTEHFERIAIQFCSIVEGASGMDRTGFLVQLYQIVPQLIAKAIALPQLQLSDYEPADAAAPIHVLHKPSIERWPGLYDLLKEKLGDWDLYSQVFDPTTDKEAIFGSLADDIADIYRDLKEGLVAGQTRQSRPEDIFWTWRLLYYSHWGKHAIDALLVLHFRLQEALE